ncbi:MAG: hypothetical protein KAV83_02850 [Desulfobacterales bacterium]|nr:hypothetical protein [Desulfobacterales bacterium]
MNKLPKCYGIVPARCTICPREKLTSKIQLMEMETFKKLLDDCICDKLNYILI